MHQIFCFKLKNLIFFVGTDDDLVTTTTISTMYRLEKEDEIHVAIQIEKNWGESKLVSKLIDLCLSRLEILISNKSYQSVCLFSSFIISCEGIKPKRLYYI